MKARVVFFGTPEFVIPVLKSLYLNFDLVGVVTAPDSIQGRKKLLTPSPVKKYCLERSLSPIFTPERLDHPTAKDLKTLRPDLFIVAAYGKILPKIILDIPTQGALNIHPSLLPNYRGPSPIQSAILNGDYKTGISIIKMDDQMDHGPILKQWVFPISEKDTSESLHTNMFADASKKLPSIIEDYLQGSLSPQPQDDTQATYCPLITKKSGFFSLKNPPSPEILDRMIRAYYPWPTVWTTLKIKEKEVRIKFLPDYKLQVEGGKPLTLKEFLNGYPELKTTIQKLFNLPS
ncbi:MAG: hypothetical protein KatS3mg089_0847 [Patescibacteria group bacterium]|nr:MAG: hypothetical protein KatS3mg089_0847 [Patescibacteria group bacterium]